MKFLNISKWNISSCISTCVAFCASMFDAPTTAHHPNPRRSSADADKPTWRDVRYIYNRVSRGALQV